MDNREKLEFEGVELKLQKGDKIKSKKGIYFCSAYSKKEYLEYELEYMGQGKWRSVGKREKLSNK